MRNIVLMLLMALTLTANAQREGGESRQQRGREQLTEYRHKFLTHDLNLSTDQQQRFFALYDEMSDRLEDLNDEFRDINRKIDTEKLSDVALDAYSRRIFEQKKLEGEIELEYYDKFKEVLNSKQLARLKKAEMQILRNLNKYQRDRRGPAPDER